MVCERQGNDISKADRPLLLSGNHHNGPGNDSLCDQPEQNHAIEDMSLKKFEIDLVRSSMLT